MDSKNPHAHTVRRAALPEVMFAADLGIALDLPEETAEAHAVSGALGHPFYVGGRVAVLRDDFLSALRIRAGAPASTDREVLP